jgi:Leucine-rich repeat (LRR) protein
MLLKSSLSLLSFLFVIHLAIAQTAVDSIAITKEYNSIEEALKNPEKVYRLNLSNQNVTIPKDAWAKFTNLEILSIKNDHLKELPQEIGLLKNLKSLDLSGNDFTTLPKSFSNLTNLQELYLNDDKNFELDKNIAVLKPLTRLVSLHLEYDSLDRLPKKFHQLSHLESLYLNNNNFLEVPVEIKGLRNLKYIDFHDNKVKIQNHNLPNQDAGLKIKF